MQDGYDSDLMESVMPGPPLQMIWVMENLHDKSSKVPDPDIFRFDKNPGSSTPRRKSSRNN